MIQALFSSRAIIPRSHLWSWFFTVATKLRRLCFYRCVSVHRGGGMVVSQHALQVVSQHVSQQVSMGEGCGLSQHALQVVSQQDSQQVSMGEGCGLSQHALQVVSQHVLQQVSMGEGGVGYPSMHCRWYRSMPCNRSRGGVPATRGYLLLEGLLLGGCLLLGDGDPTPLPRKQTATVADGTHPTGMHSCLDYFGICAGKALNSLIQTQHI